MKAVAGARRGAPFFLALALTIFWTVQADARSITLDDSGSQALTPSVPLRWRSALPTRARADNVMSGTMTVRVRINVLPFLRRVGRIYLVLPAQQPGPLMLSWSTQGRLQPGQVQSGNRTLVYAGPLTTPSLDDLLTFQFSVDGSLVRRPFPVSYYFELDEV